MRTSILGARPDTPGRRRPGIPVADPGARDRGARPRRAHRPGRGAAGPVSPRVTRPLARAGRTLSPGDLPGWRADGLAGGLVYRPPRGTLHVRARPAPGRRHDLARGLEPGLRADAGPAGARRIRLQRAESR